MGLLLGKWVLLTLMFVMISGCNPPGKPTEADRPVPADQIMDFSALFRERCAGCHGIDGKNGPAPPLNDSLFLALVTDAELLRVISEGRDVMPGQRSPMPAFARAQGGPLTEAQVHVLAEGIKKRWGRAESISSAASQFALTASGDGSAEEGARVFAHACAQCHGNEGQGNEQDGRVRQRIHDPAFLALISNQALQRIIITGRADLGMPAYDENRGRPHDFRPLTATQVQDLVALLALWRQAGLAEVE